MTDRLTPDEFQALAAPWDEKVRAIVEERLRTNYHREQLAHFNALEAATLGALLVRLIPQSEGIDLVGFIDATLGIPFGRGDRKPGQPDEATLMADGLRAMEKTSQHLHRKSFHTLVPYAQERLIDAAFHDGGFINLLYRKALHGYFAHPRAWMRIGYMGPSYPEGYGWLKESEVAQRHARAEGWDRL
ncbi:MAG: gluconate 2-dehydrogenase subunit 3 family protein [bacterium]